jgi:hypothetical protein
VASAVLMRRTEPGPHTASASAVAAKPLVNAPRALSRHPHASVFDVPDRRPLSVACPLGNGVERRLRLARAFAYAEAAMLSSLPLDHSPAKGNRNEPALTARNGGNSHL